MSRIIINKLNQKQRVRILYKSLLHLHRGLPNDLRIIGDSYVQKEFRLLSKYNSIEAKLFIQEWVKYALDLTHQLGLRGKPKGSVGKDLNVSLVEKFNEDQIIQLYELMKASGTLSKNVK